MVLFIAILILSVAGYAIYWAAKRHLYGLQALITLLLLIAFSIGGAQFGMAFERVLSRSQTRGAQYQMQLGFDALAEDAEAGQYELLADKVIYLSKHWMGVDLLLEDDSLDELVRTLESSDNIPLPSHVGVPRAEGANLEN